jgi:uncharacterized protein with FMN-binding domain
MSSAAVLAVYAAGYVRTRSAADRFDLQAADRRPAVQGRPSPGVPEEVPPGPGRREAQPVNAPVAPSVARESTPARASVSEGRIPSASKEQEGANASKQIESSVRAPKTTADGAPVQPVPAPVEPSAASASAELHAPEAPTVPAGPPKSEYKDGTYLGWGHCRHGDIEASVVIAEGRIASATISQCYTRYSCSVIDILPPQVAKRQSPDVDSVSGATQSADAFYFAVTDALAKAK